MDTTKSYKIKIYIKRRLDPVIIIVDNHEIFDKLHEDTNLYPFIKISDICISTKSIKYFTIEEVEK